MLLQVPSVQATVASSGHEMVWDFLGGTHHVDCLPSFRRWRVQCYIVPTTEPGMTHGTVVAGRA